MLGNEGEKSRWREKPSKEKKKDGKRGFLSLRGKMHKKKIQNHKWARKMSDP